MAIDHCLRARCDSLAIDDKGGGGTKLRDYQRLRADGNGLCGAERNRIATAYYDRGTRGWERYGGVGNGDDPAWR